LKEARSLLESFKYAWYGVRYAWLRERNMRIHSATAFLVFFAAWVLELQTIEFVVVSLVTGMVIVAELANTALEALIDLVIQKSDPLAAVAKNTAAGAVLVTSLAAVLVGVATFGPKVLDFETSYALVSRRPAVVLTGLAASAVVWVVSLSVPLAKKERRPERKERRPVRGK